MNTISAIKSKVCSGCGERKEFSEFASNTSRLDGVQSHCKQCFKERYYKHDPVARRKRHVERYYNISWEEYLILYEEQEGKCAICEKPISSVGTRNRKDGAHVDHDHETGEVRALLCHNCNAGIGYLQDSPEVVEKALAYLEYFKRHK